MFFGRGQNGCEEGDENMMAANRYKGEFIGALMLGQVLG